MLHYTVLYSLQTNLMYSIGWTMFNVIMYASVSETCIVTDILFIHRHICPGADVQSNIVLKDMGWLACFRLLPGTCD